MSYKEGVPFYRMLQLHTARRTFATNMYRRGMSLASIMAVTGHSTEEMLRKYLKLTDKEVAIMAAEEYERLSV